MKHWVASRQIGKTHAVAFEVSMIASLGRNGPLCGERALIISKDDDSSKAVLRQCVKWIRLFQDLGIVRFDGDPTAGEIRLDNGVQIVSIPGCRPEAARGPSGSVWLDEFPYHRDQQGNYDAAVGVTTLGGLIRIVSTPFSDTDLFWTIRENLDGLYDAWTRHKTTIHDALAVGILKPNGQRLTLEELQRKMPLKERFACEYECVPLSSAEAYFDRILLDLCTELFSLGGGSLFGGFDAARSGGDLAALCEVRRQDQKYQCTEVVFASREADHEAQEDIAIREFKRRGWKRLTVDAQGVGSGSAERIRKACGGTARVEELRINSEVHGTLMTDLKALMQQRRLSIPNDRDLWLDLYSIKKIVGTNSVRYEADRTKRGHADRAWALAMAVRAAGRSIPTPPTGETYDDRLDWGDDHGSRQDW